ncbi:MAG TPA: HU family DNA-binding protein [Candidatus Scatavimonas merdigallinarum]|uniref:HU family DNA-binding protein n=1 Tax=Candidatus Scatavimonas merdigallinarum TaxID=2840914 RepID=A0A9D0ZGK2_9FIRM|nr:HU family DNA-binding protein [Acutalibacteraceae bacterium]HIQ80160.1 HU family DNA-binding protein [Candidatus Scatavimonas merdigallinarum]HIR03642.1 HU family DNA-binding protein [Candidatus Scatovicinus merdipullorum]
MNKTELIAAVAEKSELSKKDAEKAVTAVLDTIVDCVAKAEKVQIVGFGTFEQRQRNERTGCDPRTKTQITIPASKVPAFKAGKAFKEAVDQ